MEMVSSKVWLDSNKDGMKTSFCILDEYLDESFYIKDFLVVISHRNQLEIVKGLT